MFISINIVNNNYYFSKYSYQQCFFFSCLHDFYLALKVWCNPMNGIEKVKVYYQKLF